MIINFENIADFKKIHHLDKVVFFDGVFDLFHIGHLTALQSLPTFGDVVVVGVMSDDWVRAKKGKSRPIMNQNERAAIVDSIKSVDYVLILEDKTRLKTSDILKTLNPNVFVTSDSSWCKTFLDSDFDNIKLQIVDRKLPNVHSNVHPPSTTKLLEYVKSL